MALYEWAGFALFISLIYWYFLMWHSFNLTRQILIFLNTVGTCLITFFYVANPWPITDGMLLILIMYAVSTLALFKLPSLTK
ncbi:hypothetical protein GA840_10525 [Pediococcus ethanolidurans]|nr:hypothetical protein [Pediococcus ethanolidurans]